MTNAFDDRLDSAECSQELRDIVTFLRDVAARAGDDIVSRSHGVAGRGWGITYKRAKRVFCSFDPKPFKGHVVASISGADEFDLKHAGTVHKRKNARSWVDVKDMRGAKVLKSLIERAYVDAGERS